MQVSTYHITLANIPASPVSGKLIVSRLQVSTCVRAPQACYTEMIQETKIIGSILVRLYQIPKLYIHKTAKYLPRERCKLSS
jgi:hypothetical protein